MKKRYLKVTAWIATALSSVLGLVGCGGSFFGGDEPEPMVEYGVPSATFTLKATVKHQGTPVEGIRIEVLDSNRPELNLAEQTTDAEGKATVKATIFPREGYQKYRVTDIDGAKNGSYQSQVDSVLISRKDLEGKSEGWHEGNLTKSVEIELKEQKN